MKKNILHTSCKYLLLLSGSALLFASCNKFLDEMPDNRTELDNPDKITQMLVSAYPYMPANLHELMSDNVTDYSKNVDIYDAMFEEAYLFQETTDEAQDSPSYVWEENYKAISAANHVLEAIENYEGSEDLSAQKGEALLCRAYAHFILCNTFCQAYNPESSATDLGIPYITEPETTVFTEHGRETVAEVYEKIAKDLEAGLPLIDDNLYSHPKYHFTKKAAHAFASQFYLYYGKYDLAISNADQAIGQDPTSLFRNWDLFTGTSSAEYANAYISSEEAANIFIVGFGSTHLRFRSGRYIHTFQLQSEVGRSQGPWGSALDPYSIAYVIASRSYFMPKATEYFMYTDVANGIGYSYVTLVVFSTEKTILNRAEAYALSGEYDLAARDLNYFYRQAGANTSLSADEIADFYETANSSLKKPLAPRFTLEPGKQTNLVHACLHARRIVTILEGGRLEDLKRYGIAYTHEVDGASNIEIEPYDKRLAVQLPKAVVAAGMEPNPR